MKNHSAKSAFQALILIPIIFLLCASCAGIGQNIHSQINNDITAGEITHAAQTLNKHPQGYGSNNQLLYLLDKGLLLHLTGEYKKSILAFEKAKQRYDELYTKSISRMASGMLWNDTTRHFRGDGYEKILINIFQALNYALLNNINEALVEARDLDSFLHTQNSATFQDKAFAEFLMGILYEASKNQLDINDAFISYRNALKYYIEANKKNPGYLVPDILKQNILATASYINTNEWRQLKKMFGNKRYDTLKTKSTKSEIYLIHYHGLAPIKQEKSIVLPLPDGQVTKLVLPVYKKRTFQITPGYSFIAKNNLGNRFKTTPQLCLDINTLAIKTLEKKKAQFIAKTISRTSGKYFIAKKQAENIKKKYGETSAEWFKLLTNLYIIFSEQADLRSWLTLPASVSIARLILEPGKYQLFFNEKNIGSISIKPGEKKFILQSTR